jgi:hypothetical protein
MVEQLWSAKYNEYLPIPVVLISVIYGRQAAQHTDSPHVKYFTSTAILYDVMSLFWPAVVPGHGNLATAQ